MLATPDPLRTFELDQDAWDQVVKSVTDEGFDGWDQFAPAIVAAIQEGYMDRHLQMLGYFLRSRYLHLKNGEQSPVYEALVAEAQHLPDDDIDTDIDITPITRHRPTSYEELVSLLGTANFPDFPSGGITPVRAMASPNETARGGEFRVHGFIFKKADLVGKHFVFKSPDVLAIFLIERVDKVNAVCRIVEHVPTASGPKGRIGASWTFRLARQRRWFNIPNQP